jgi:hypothetical protein
MVPREPLRPLKKGARYVLRLQLAEGQQLLTIIIIAAAVAMGTERDAVDNAINFYSLC